MTKEVVKMTKDTIDNDEQSIPNYALLPFALLKSQLYWLYSAICWIFKVPPESESKILSKTSSVSEPESNPELNPELNPESKPKSNRSRSKSEPDGRQRIPQLVKRRSSAPGVRSRPTTHDERNGTTCPPVWWQKTKIKLGHKPYDDNLSSRKHSVRSKRKMLIKLLHRKHVVPM
ncbi:hypothetical protein G6F56_008976 [Rhizopus delemar]|nr:hypothetical protein G6F56_008976 [Rhizopus delemar]